MRNSGVLSFGNGGGDSYGVELLFRWNFGISAWLG